MSEFLEQEAEAWLGSHCKPSLSLLTTISLKVNSSLVGRRLGKGQTLGYPNILSPRNLHFKNPSWIHCALCLKFPWRNLVSKAAKWGGGCNHTNPLG